MMHRPSAATPRELALTMYGIRQCDTCRKALKWLEERGVSHRFHDLRNDGLSSDRVRSWLASPFADRMVNRRRTTWRKWNDEQKAAGGNALVRLIVAHPTLVKRPVFERGRKMVAVGFGKDEQATLLEPDE
jgi:arsenate reductase (glutaredoxin)